MINIKIDDAAEVSERSYPYLARHKEGQFVLFTGPKTGIELRQQAVERFVDTWAEDDFDPLSRGAKVIITQM